MSSTYDFPSDNGPCKNTDRELWREPPKDYYAHSIHVTESGGIGIDCGGHVIVMKLSDWHRIAQAHLKTLEAPAFTNGERQSG